MNKLLLLLAITTLILSCSTQKTFSGKIEDRDLTWDDFVGVPSDSVDYDAFTVWNVYYQYDTVIFHDNKATIEFRVWRELSDASWVRKKNKSR